MTTQVNITLKALTGNLSPAERILNLNPDVLAIQIGRASKSPTKNLSAAVDNAWFDSPVMSRNHAEMVFNPQNSALAIQDIGSMHGTYVNDRRLNKDELKELANGDVLLLGAEVKRGIETFPACSFQLNYDIRPYELKVSKGYNFPESSDIEDEEDYDFSDIEMDEKNTSMSDDGISIEGSSFKTSDSSLEPIDLTKDDTPESNDKGGISSSTHRVDLVTPPPPGRQSNGQPQLGHFQVPITITNRIEPIVLETDEEEGGFSTDSDDVSEDAQSESNDSREGSLEENNEELDNVNDLLSMNDDLVGMSSTEPEMNRIGSVVENNEASEDEYSDSDLCLSEAGREGIRALFEDGLLGKEDSNDKSKHTDLCHSSLDANLLQQVSFADTRANVKPLQLFDYEPLGKASPVKISFDRITEHREPSPSDAAMVKPAAINRLAVNLINLDNGPNKEWFEMTSESLGDKTGKHAFFEARSYNKAKVNQGAIDLSTRPSCLTPEFSTATKEALSESICHEPKPIRVFAAPRGSWARRSRTPRDTLDSTPAPTTIRSPAILPLPYLDNHAQAPPVIDRDPSPEPDLTSAVKFNESKIKIDGAYKNTANLSGRSKLTINDIIDGSMTNTAQSSVKRKADDISNDNANADHLASASLYPNRLSPDSLVVEDLRVTSASLQPQTLSKQPTNSSPDELEAARPAKRLKKFAQRLSYAALGGVAMGGALLSVLVATAPEYL